MGEERGKKGTNDDTTFSLLSEQVAISANHLILN